MISYIDFLVPFSPVAVSINEQCTCSPPAEEKLFHQVIAEYYSSNFDVDKYNPETANSKQYQLPNFS